MKLRFTSPAELAYAAVLDYLSERSPNAAVQLAQEVEHSLDRLLRFPQLGHAIPEFPSSNFKEIIVGSHRFFYRVARDTIWIVGVWHGAQIPAEPWLSEAGANR